MDRQKQLIASLVKNGVLKTPAIQRAFEHIDRKYFIPHELAADAYEDTALPIGEGQTISQPYTVAFMLELLRPKAGDHIVDIGYGSGWQTALLADIVGAHGTIYAIERISELCALGKQNVAKYPEHEKQVEFFCQDATPGLPDTAQRIGGFDGIIAAADVRTVPKSWREQIKIGGRLVYPGEGTIYAELKRAKDSFEKTEYPGFIFVPFISDHKPA